MRRVNARTVASRAACLSFTQTNPHRLVSSHQGTSPPPVQKKKKKPRRGTDGRTIPTTSPTPRLATLSFTDCNPAGAFGFAAASSMTSWLEVLAREARVRREPCGVAQSQPREEEKRGRRREESRPRKSAQNVLSCSIFNPTRIRKFFRRSRLTSPRASD